MDQIKNIRQALETKRIYMTDEEIQLIIDALMPNLFTPDGKYSWDGEFMPDVIHGKGFIELGDFYLATKGNIFTPFRKLEDAEAYMKQ